VTHHPPERRYSVEPADLPIVTTIKRLFFIIDLLTGDRVSLADGKPIFLRYDSLIQAWHKCDELNFDPKIAQL
jgi:hypothetical protein